MKKRYFGIATLILGFAMIFLSDMSYTGAAFGIQPAGNTAFSLIGMGLVFCSMIFMASGGIHKKITIDEVIEDSRLEKLANKAMRNPNVKRGYKHLISELGKGNTHPGRGIVKRLEGTDITYFGSNETRVYTRIEEKDHEIIYHVKGVSGKNDQDEVINTLKRYYKK